MTAACQTDGIKKIANWNWPHWKKESDSEIDFGRRRLEQSKPKLWIKYAQIDKQVVINLWLPQVGQTEQKNLKTALGQIDRKFRNQLAAAASRSNEKIGKLKLVKLTTKTRIQLAIAASRNNGKNKRKTIANFTQKMSKQLVTTVSPTDGTRKLANWAKLTTKTGID